MLNTSVFRAICQNWGRPVLDLMATRENTQLPLFVSPVPDPSALAIDAMAFDLRGWDVYAFPPASMIALLLAKIKACRVTATLVLPRWPNQPWFPTLLRMLCDIPVKLPVTKTLLHMPGTSMYHPAPEQFHLHACRLSGLPCVIEAFQRRLDEEYSPLSAHPPPRYTIQGGEFSPFGVLNGRSIPFKQLRWR